MLFATSIPEQQNCGFVYSGFHYVYDLEGNRMDDLLFRFGRCISYLSCSAIALVLISIPAVSAENAADTSKVDTLNIKYTPSPILNAETTANIEADAMDLDYVGLASKEYEQTLAFYQYFTDETMNEAYTHGFGFLYQYVWWLMGKKSGFLVDGGLMYAQGQSIQTDPNWEINSTRLWMIVMPVSLNYLVRFRGDDKTSLMPFIGIGASGFIGFEQISADVYRDTPVGEAHYDWRDTSYRHSWALHALVGAHKKVSDRTRFAFEIRWIQGFDGRIKRYSLSDEELQEGWGDAFESF